MNALARWFGRHPLLTLVAHGLLTAVLGMYALRIRIERSIESLLPVGDAEMAYYDRARAMFGNDDVAVVGVQAHDLFAAPTLEKIARLTAALAAIDGVERVLSVTNAVDPAADPVRPPRLLATIPPPPGAIEALVKKLSATPVYGGNLIAADLSGAAINLFFKDLTDAQYRDLGIDRKIRQVLEAERGSLFFTGGAHLRQVAVEMMERDVMRFTPIALGLVVLVLWASFRTVRGVVLPVLSVSLAVVWTLGVMVLCGKAITLGTFMLPPLLIVIGSAYGIHVMACYYEQVVAAAGRDERVARACGRVGPPLLISALTTGVGFGTLMINHITAIWDFGAFAVVGVLLLAITSLTFIPAALQLMRRRPERARAAHISPRLAGMLCRIGEGACVSRRRTLWAAAAAGVVALAGARLIRVDSDFLDAFDRQSDVRTAHETVNREIVGSERFYLVIEGDEPGTLKRREVLELVKELQGFLQTLPGITSSLSLADYLELFDARRGAVALWDDPTRLREVLQTVSANPATFKSVVTGDFRAGNILVRTNLSSSKHIEETLDRIRAHVAEHFPADLQVHPTGSMVLLAGMTSDIVTGQIASLSLALAVILVVMAAMFLSLRVGALAIVPNVLAVATFFGVMGWLDIPLNLGTSLIAAIALGLAVDATIHYMARLNVELRGETQQVAAVTGTLQAVGPPMLFTTVALFLGFLTFAFSSFVPVQDFGILTGVTMVAALGTNLLLLPALLATTKVITLWDLLALKLGQNPTESIPLFAGLGAAQARIVVLMGETKCYAPDQYVVRRGESSDEMYVVIQGSAKVWAGGDGSERRPVFALQRGDVFGEMGVVRQHQRSADVVAAEDMEVLAVNERFLERLQLRYPRIAAQVFLNLTRILSDRLQRMTEQYVHRES
jgi:predicted RND superfamily exporter protein